MSKFRQLSKKWLVLVATLSLSGCSSPLVAPHLAPGQTPTPSINDQNAGLATYNSSSSTKKTLDPNGWNKILNAIQKNTAIQTFSIKGSMSSRGLKQSHTTAVYGHIGLPDRMSVNEVTDGQSYYMYQDETSTYYREQNVWRAIPRVTVPNPWQNLTKLTQAKPHEVYRLPDTIIISFPAEVYQFEADALEIGSLGFGAQATQTSLNTKTIPSLFTFYIDKKSKLLKRVTVESTSSIEDVGTFTTNYSMDFFNLDGKGVDLTQPLGLVDQLKKEKSKG